MRHGWPLAILTSGLAAALCGQTIQGPVFEAASLKKLAAPPPIYQPLTGGPGTADPTRAAMHYWISDMLPKAFDRSAAEFVNLDKLPQDLYDFAAVLPADATKDDYRAMLRNLLIERFHLRYHAETREIKHYELRVAPGGPKMQTASGLSSDDATHTIQDGYVTFPPGVNSSFYGNGPRFSVQRVNSTVAEFAAQMKDQWLRATIDDQTGLTGKYDFRLRLTAAPNPHFSPVTR